MSRQKASSIHLPVEITEILHSCATTSNHFTRQKITHKSTATQVLWSCGFPPLETWLEANIIPQTKGGVQVEITIKPPGDGAALKEKFVVPSKRDAEPMLAWLQPLLQAIKV